jgi:hypothetical protein
MRDVDPVEELHRIRRKICKKAGGTPADYVRYYLEMDREKVAAAEAAKLAEGKRGRKSPKPAAKTSARKPAQRRKTVTA